MRARCIGLALPLALAALSTPAPAQDFAPVVVASIHDEPPDGMGDTFNGSPFEGLLREQTTREDRAIQEFDLAPVAGMSISGATLSGRIVVNNAFDNGPRTFDFLLYAGNGAADLSDFQIPATVVGSGSYSPPTDTELVYSFDVTAAVQTLLAGGATWIGLRVDPTSNPNFPNILTEADSKLSVSTGGVGVGFCAGDGSGTPCPCGNTGAAGHGCANGSAADGALLTAGGSASVAAGDLVLLGSDLAPNQPGLYFQGDNAIGGGSGMIFGDGLRCAGSNVLRLQTVTASGVGTSGTSIPIAATVGVVPGETKRYQLWYRDPIGSICGSGFNLTNGLEVLWMP